MRHGNGNVVLRYSGAILVRTSHSSSLHTTGMYYIKEKKTGFCTVSQFKRQDASAIWTHMEPALRYIRLKFSNVDTIHFWSDGPSKQHKKHEKCFSPLQCPSNTVVTGQGARRRTRGYSRSVAFIQSRVGSQRNQYKQSRTRGTRIVRQKRVR